MTIESYYCCSDQNKITGTGAITNYNASDFSSFTPPETPQKPTDSQIEAKTRAQEYSKMSKAEMNAAYDKLRASDPAKAATEGMKMHKAFFNKPSYVQRKKHKPSLKRRKKKLKVKQKRKKKVKDLTLPRCPKVF